MTSLQTSTRSIEERYHTAFQVLNGLFHRQDVVLNNTIRPTWIGDSDCFWFVRELNGGCTQYRLVNAVTRENEAAFNHQALAEALSQASGERVVAEQLPIAGVEISLDPLTVSFDAFDKRWRYAEAAAVCQEAPALLTNEESISPDGRFIAFRRDMNLWVRNAQSGEERALTTDGGVATEYASESPCWGFERGGFIGIQAIWSADSKRLLTIQREARLVKDYPVVHHVPTDGSIRPTLEFNKMPLPGDEHIEEVRLLCVDVTTGERQLASYGTIPASRNGWGFFDCSNFGWWSKDGRTAYFVDVDRYYKYARVVEFNTDTGACRILFEERAESQINLMNNGDGWPFYVPLVETEELLWYSERTGWAHLYLYDLKTGKMKNVVTEGEWLVRDIVTTVPERREVFLQRGCHKHDQNPYYRDLVRVNIDTGELVTLASGDYDILAMAFTDMESVYLGINPADISKRGTSPTGNVSVFVKSRLDAMSDMVVIDRDGNELLPVETSQVVSLPEGWKWPTPVKILADDGETDIYGAIYYPTDFDPEKSYPVILNPYNQPDFPISAIGALHQSMFSGYFYLDASAMAQLGFIVVQIDGRGGAYRSAAFKDAGYGNVQLPVMLADQVAGLKQLAKRYSFMDMNRLGIMNSTNGGAGIVQALLDYPDLFKVAVALPLHDARLMAGPMWGDMFEGKTPQVLGYPEDRVEKLQGKLLLMGGMLDMTTPPAGIFRLVEALQKANKDFDMILLPNMGHEPSEYLVRRSWDYLVEHLAGETPPKEFSLAGSFDLSALPVTAEND